MSVYKNLDIDQKFNSIVTPNNFTLILVHGKAHSGKGVVASVLRERCGFIELGFADYLKEIAIKTFSWPPELIHHGSSRSISSRKFMQTLGEAGRMYNPDFWVNELYSRIYNDILRLSTGTKLKIVVSDLRYKNEAMWGRRIGGVLWKVVRKGDFKGIQTGEDHASEVSLDDWNDWDHVFVNNTDLLSFKSEVLHQYNKGLNVNI